MNPWPVATAPGSDFVELLTVFVPNPDFSVIRVSVCSTLDVPANVPDRFPESVHPG